MRPWPAALRRAAVVEIDFLNFNRNIRARAWKQSEMDRRDGTGRRATAVQVKAKSTMTANVYRAEEGAGEERRGGETLFLPTHHIIAQTSSRPVVLSSRIKHKSQKRSSSVQSDGNKEQFCKWTDAM